MDRAVNPKLVETSNRAEEEEMSAIVAKKEATEKVAEGLRAIHHSNGHWLLKFVCF